MAKKVKRVNPNKEKIWQIVDKYQNVVTFNEDFCDWKPLTLTHFTKAEAENVLVDWEWQCYKISNEEHEEFLKKGYHIVKDKNKAREIYNRFNSK